MIDNVVIENIRQKADIVDVISKYVEVSKKGRNYTCICPFHDDHDPSMSISQDKQIYKCFVCGAGGNVFGFVQNYEKISYIQSVIKVGDMVGIHVEDNSPKKQVNPIIERCYQTLNETVSFCSYELEQIKDENIINYLIKRDLNRQIIDKFNIGFNPSGNVLVNFLKKKGFTSQEIISCNVGFNSDKGLIDVYSSRLMFPIDDIDGHFIGFTARSLDSNNPSKYINTSETMVFKKGIIVYNGSRAKLSCRRENNVLICEGVMDVIAFYKAGIENVVATLGTACTKEQLLLIKTLSPHITLAYDGDKAGQKAIYKAGKLALSLGLKVHVFNNTTNLDPDELYLKYGKEMLQEMKSKPKNWMQFVYDFIKSNYDLSDYEQKKQFALQMLNELKQCQDKLDQQAFLNLLQQETGFTFNVNITNSVNQPSTVNKVNISSQSAGANSKLDRLQRQIINQLTLDMQAQQLYKRDYDYLPFDEYNTIARIICTNSKDKIVEYAALLDLVQTDRQREILHEISNDETLTNVYNQEVFIDTFRQINIEMKHLRIQQLKSKLETVLDANESSEIQHQINKIYAEIYSLKK